MRLLNLNSLRIGDIILETGDPRVAAATGGPFGHASVALGRLVRIEAGKQSGVEINAFPLVGFRRGGERVVGMLIDPDEDLAVFRKRTTVDEGEVIGEAIWEGGRRYSVAKLLDLKDLKPAVRDRLAGRVTRASGEESEARFCSEVVARILGLGTTNVSPNALRTAPEVIEVDGAVLELGQGWTREGTETANEAVDSKVREIELGTAKLLANDVTEEVAQIRKGSGTTTEAASRLQEAYSAKLRDQLQALEAIRMLEPTILTTRTSPI